LLAKQQEKLKKANTLLQLMNSEQKQSTLSKLLFAVLILSIYTYLNYWEILFWPPQGIHFMRQTDCLSFIAYYIHTGNGLFEPGTLSLFSNEGKTASEFPLIYFLMQFVWIAFGRQEFLLKLFHLSFTTLGLWHLFLLAKDYTRYTITSLLIVLFVFSSSTWIYYANNFLPDASALGLTLSGLYFYTQYIRYNKTRAGLYAMLFFLNAALFKVSYFIYPIATIIHLLWTNRTYIRPHLSVLIQFLISAAIIAAWTLYVSKYNQQNHGYFLSKARPFWILDAETIQAVVRMIAGYWFTWYYSLYQMFVWAIVLILIVVFTFKCLSETFLSIIMLLGAISYMLLFFLQFHDHDYYMLAVFPALIFALLTVIHQVQKRAAFSFHLIGIAVLLITGTTGIAFAKNYVNWRYWNARENEIDQFAYVGDVLRNAQQVLDEAGIDKNAKFIYLKDPGVNGASYYCNRFGWNIWDTSYRFLQAVPAYIESDASYILLTDSNYAQHPLVNPFLDEKVVTHNRFHVYTVQKNSALWPVFEQHN
jgi:hypothetical protein